MTSEHHCFVHPSTDIVRLRNTLIEHVIVYPPPYNLEQMVRHRAVRTGRAILIHVDHASRNVRIAEPCIRHHVIQTVVSTFRNHRLASPALASPAQRPALASPAQRLTLTQPVHCARNKLTQSECPICLELIGTLNGFALPCSHSFHRTCIQTWMHNNPSCPVCRLT